MDARGTREMGLTSERSMRVIVERRRRCAMGGPVLRLTNRGRRGIFEIIVSGLDDPNLRQRTGRELVHQ